MNTTLHSSDPIVRISIEQFITTSFEHGRELKNNIDGTVQTTTLIRTHSTMTASNHVRHQQTVSALKCAHRTCAQTNMREGQNLSDAHNIRIETESKEYQAR